MGAQIGSCWFLLAGGGAGFAPSGYGWALLRMLAALALVCLLAVVVLRWVSRRLGGGQSTRGLLRVIERCPLAARQSLWLVEVSGRYFLLGASDSGISRLAELDPSQLPQAISIGAAPAGNALFRQVLRRVDGLARVEEEAVAAAEEQRAGREERR